ncbi:MAG: coproporphyrinogen dehydrogenase HemZ [Oscillospiraceae bacterium]|jgi:oxygen-independent coproporphyrinogen-3 oxidase|nr:coproporphyrinogen dehydrogenase HemZ [Oscillospiraceae bacterium]
MIVYINGTNNNHEILQVCRLFFPEREITEVSAPPDLSEITASGRVYVCLDIHTDDRFIYADVGVKTALFDEGERLCADISCLSDEEKKDELEHEAIVCMYEMIVKLTGFTPPWGILIGVRPIKLLRSLEGRHGAEEAIRLFRDYYKVSDGKINLSARTLKNESAVLAQSRSNSFSLYISIPFCPSRCKYCSFVAHSIENAGHLIPEYVNLLVKEIGITAELARRLNLRLESVYMGGGTPTTLSAEQMTAVLSEVTRRFDMTTVREFTVEAGRPDTITADKLIAMKQCGVGRISINPQTMDDDILRRIGRRHTAKDVANAYHLARSIGFSHINMDLIAGLEGDTPCGFEKTVREVVSLNPEAVTVHTLSLKRSARLSSQREDFFRGEMLSCREMTELADRELSAAGYEPYYLYRQTRTLGNLENVGWSRSGFEGVYNIFMMDETHSVLAVGAGGTTKLRQQGTNNIERITNYKFPYEYISMFDSLMEKKKGIEEFYEKFC